MRFPNVEMYGFTSPKQGLPVPFPEGAEFGLPGCWSWAGERIELGAGLGGGIRRGWPPSKE